MAEYVTFTVPDDVQQRVLELFDIARSTGEICKGTNETTKAIERGKAELVAIAGDVKPPEIVMHLGPLCEEKGIPYVFVKSKKDLGGVTGVNVPTASAVIQDAGEGRKVLRDTKLKIKKQKE